MYLHKNLNATISLWEWNNSVASVCNSCNMTYDDMCNHVIICHKYMITLKLSRAVEDITELLVQLLFMKTTNALVFLFFLNLCFSTTESLDYTPKNSSSLFLMHSQRYDLRQKRSKASRTGSGVSLGAQQLRRVSLRVC